MVVLVVMVGVGVVVASEATRCWGGGIKSGGTILGRRRASSSLSKFI